MNYKPIWENAIHKTVKTQPTKYICAWFAGGAPVENVCLCFISMEFAITSMVLYFWGVRMVLLNIFWEIRFLKTTRFTKTIWVKIIYMRRLWLLRLINFSWTKIN